MTTPAILAWRVDWPDGGYTNLSSQSRAESVESAYAGSIVTPLVALSDLHAATARAEALLEQRHNLRDSLDRCATERDQVRALFQEAEHALAGTKARCQDLQREVEEARANPFGFADDLQALLKTTTEERDALQEDFRAQALGNVQRNGKPCECADCTNGHVCEWELGRRVGHVEAGAFHTQAEVFAMLNAIPAVNYCDRCDGCGWYEGGRTLQTICEVCKGTGKVAA